MPLRALFQRQGFGQFNHLPLTEAQLTAQQTRIDIQIDFGQLQACCTVQFFPVQAPETRELVFAAHEQVLRHRQVEQDRLLLIHHRNAVRRCATGPVQHDRRTVQLQMTFVRLVDSGQDLHQRRFACAIFADQPNHFVLAHFKRDVLQHRDAVEPFTHIIEREHGASSLDDPCFRTVEGNGDSRDNQHALHALLDVRRDAHQHHAVADHHHDQDTQQGSQRAAIAARQ
ncbi:hypothetical protein D3C86_1061910 [compost metagenome]